MNVEAAAAYVTGNSPLGIAVPVVPVDASSKRALVKWGGGSAPGTVDEVTAAWSRHPDAAVAVVLGNTRIVVLDVEGPGHGHELDAVLDSLHAAFGPLPSTLVASTSGGGCHFYFSVPDSVPIDRLGQHLVTTDGEVVLGVDVKRGSIANAGGYVLVPMDLDGHAIHGRAWTDLAPIAPMPMTLLSAASKRSPAQRTDGASIPQGHRHSRLLSLGGAMRRWSASPDAIEQALLATNTANCNPPLPTREVITLARDVGARYLPAPLDGPTEWPSPMREAAFHGIAGDFVRAVSPYSEADEAALLLSFISAFGSVVGPGPRDMIGEDAHGPRIWPVFVGDTAAARKGTSFSVVQKLFCEVDETWRHCIAANVGSGEVVIHQIRDARTEPSAVGSWTVVDAGVDDKRLFIAESEFASVLRVAARDGSVLSPIIRSAWDGGVLRHVVKHQPAIATDAHVVVLGHITPEEIRKELSAVERANGFANRFMFAMVRRSKMLPRAGAFPHGLLDSFVPRLRTFVDAARQRGLVEPTETFWAVYEPAYGRLSNPPRGMAGSILARGAPYVRRLALTYALLDGESRIFARHAEAALAVWDYCSESAQYLFQQRMGQEDADRVLAAIERSPDGLPRTAVRDLFAKHRRRADLDALRDQLAGAGRITVTSEATAGRSAEVWRLAGAGASASVASVANTNASHKQRNR